MLKILAASALATLALSSSGFSAGSAAIGFFNGTPNGYSFFTERGSSINVQGSYSNLNSRSAYFTVIYGNGNCDPAQAFPIGPFYTDRRGNGSINQRAANPNAIDVASTGSISVRRGDNQTDIDGDGLRGPTDVVAVAGNPSVGLIQCDTAPFTN